MRLGALPLGFEKGVGRSEESGLESDGLDQPPQGLEQGCVIIDDVDYSFAGGIHAR